MNAFGCVPNVLTYNILNSERVLGRDRRLALTQVLRLTQKVRGHCLDILNCLLNDNSLGEGIVEALVMNRHCGAVKKSLFTITEPMGGLIESPVVTAIFLFP